MNRVKKYLTWTDNILVDATYDCAKPYDSDKFLSDSYTQWFVSHPFFSYIRLSGKLKTILRLKLFD